MIGYFLISNQLSLNIHLMLDFQAKYSDSEQIFDGLCELDEY